MTEPHITFETDEDVLNARDRFWRRRAYLALGWVCFLLGLFVFPISLLRLIGIFGLVAALIIILTLFLVLINHTVKNELLGHTTRHEAQKRKNEERLRASREVLTLDRDNTPVHYVIGDDGELRLKPTEDDDNAPTHTEDQDQNIHTSWTR